MAVLKPGVPVTQDTPHLLVENKLSAGRYRFRLVAIDSAGLESAPAEIVVSVQAPAPQPEPPPPPPRTVVRPEIATRLVRPVIGAIEPSLKPMLRPGIIKPLKPR